jgi:endonuclease YncB( thermonuclease family)
MAARRSLQFLTMVAASMLCAAGPVPGLNGVVTAVVDGDTMDISLGQVVRRIDLAEVDCPELEQPFGREARQAVIRLALRTKVRIDIASQNQYGQASARVFLGDGRELNAELVSRGLAWWQPKPSHDGHLARLERNARVNRRGLWASPSPVAPWEWREQIFYRSLREAERLGQSSPAPETARSCIPRSECCKVCSKGVACGNSCISARYTCHQGHGCACDSWDICE